MYYFYSALKIFLVCYIVVLCFLYFFQRKLIYYPSKSRPNLENFKNIYTEVNTQTKEAFNLIHWYHKKSAPYIIVFHGNAGNIEDRGLKFKFLTDHYSVLLASYRGYGLNPGKPTEKHLIEDSSLVLKWLLKQEGVSSKEVILFGESLGSGVVTALATQYTVKAVIFDGAFSSVTDVSKSIYPFMPVSLMLKDKWNSEERIKKVQAPTLFIHSKQDRTVSFRFGKKLFASANEPKKHIWLEGPGHTSNLDEEFVKKSVIDFIESVP